MSHSTICLTTVLLLTQFATATATLPSDSRGWQTVPNVIRADGVESFVLEVETNGPVSGVTLDVAEFYFNLPGGQELQTLRDDGLGSDRVAGDFIFTTEPLTYNTNSPIAFPNNFRHDPSSPAGLHIESPGILRIQEFDTSESRFLVGPEVGLLRPDIPLTPMQTLSTNVVSSPHLINVRTSERNTQKFLRGISTNTSALTQSIYDVIPDAFDFLMLFSTNKIERTEFTAGDNFVSGRHRRVQVNYSGTGLSQFDSSSIYGSDGKLLSINAIDAMERGIKSNNAVHELLHQWGYSLSSSLGLGSGAHPSPFSNIGSILGGFQWIDNGDGTYTINDDEGASGATRISPLEAYLMGLTDGSDIGTLLAYDSSATPPVTKARNGEPVTQEEIVAMATLADIQAIHGVRTPLPADAQRDFSIGFVAESHERLLTPTEMTFYDILAEHMTSDVPAGTPLVSLEFNWPSIEPFFGYGTTWTSDVPLPALMAGDFDNDGDVDGKDFLLWQRGGSPSPLSATDLSNWQTNYGDTQATASSAVVPEPSAAALLFLAISFLVTSRLRTKL